MRFFKIIEVFGLLFQACNGYELCGLLSSDCFLCISDNMCTFVVLSTGNRLCVFTDLVFDYSIRTKASSTRKCAKLQEEEVLKSENGNFISTTTTASPKPNQDLKTSRENTLIVSERSKNTLVTPPNIFITSVQSTTNPPIEMNTSIFSDHSTLSTTPTQNSASYFHTASKAETTVIPNKEGTTHPSIQNPFIASDRSPTSLSNANNSNKSESYYMSLPISAYVNILNKTDNESSTESRISITTNLSGPLISQTKGVSTGFETTISPSVNYYGSITTTNESRDSTLSKFNETVYTTTETPTRDHQTTQVPTNSLENHLYVYAKPDVLPTNSTPVVKSHVEAWDTEDYIIAIVIPILIFGIILTWFVLYAIYKRRPRCNFGSLRASTNSNQRFARENIELGEWVYANHGITSENFAENFTSFIHTKASERSCEINLQPSSSNEKYWEVPL